MGRIVSPAADVNGAELTDDRSGRTAPQCGVTRSASKRYCSLLVSSLGTAGMHRRRAGWRIKIGPSHLLCFKAFDGDAKVRACLIYNLIGRQHMQLLTVRGRKVKRIQGPEGRRTLSHPLPRPEKISGLD